MTTRSSDTNSVTASNATPTAAPTPAASASRTAVGMIAAGLRTHSSSSLPSKWRLSARPTSRPTSTSLSHRTTPHTSHPSHPSYPSSDAESGSEWGRGSSAASDTQSVGASDSVESSSVCAGGAEAGAGQSAHDQQGPGTVQRSVVQCL